MFINAEGGYHHLGESDELAPLRYGNVRTPWWRSKLCWILCISVTMIGSLLSFASGLYCLLIDRIDCACYFLICAVVCLTTSVHCITSDWSPFTPRTSSMSSFQAIPIRVATSDNLKTLLTRSNSERVQSAGPDRSPSTLSLPAYILVPMEQNLEREDSSSASTESTLSAESGQGEEFATAPTSQNVSQESLPTAGLTQAAVVISQIVKESLGDKESVGAASEKNADGSKSETAQEGVRQRKITPMEPQKCIPLPEGGNIEPSV